MKPNLCLYPNCFECSYQDCMYSDLEQMDIVAQDKFDDELKVVEPEILRRRKSLKKYNASQKGKERHKKYINSEKGKISEKKRQNKKIESGKNSEYCRRYYQKMKAKKLLEQK